MIVIKAQQFILDIYYDEHVNHSAMVYPRDFFYITFLEFYLFIITNVYVRYFCDKLKMMKQT